MGKGIKTMKLWKSVFKKDNEYLETVLNYYFLKFSCVLYGVRGGGVTTYQHTNILSDYLHKIAYLI